MAKVYDITDKLKLEGNPKLVINGVELEVNTDAESVLMLMNIISGKGDVDAINLMCEHVFTKDSQKKLKAMKLSFDDYSTVVSVGLDVAIGKAPFEETEQGNA